MEEPVTGGGLWEYLLSTLFARLAVDPVISPSCLTLLSSLLVMVDSRVQSPNK